MKTVVSIENLYKEYKLGVIGRGTLYRDLQSWWALKRGREDPNSIIGFKKSLSKNHLAVNNINLEIKEGDVLGIIGSNGAGKSTLLKLMSRVTAPTKGLIKIKGKIASLLEVGTGFHPELTGRENIYLNGSINGMSKREVDKKIDQIIEFAGVKKFVDTPIKRYSSGMHVRLGFAVAAHLDPDILIVDEVLAVGDADFQKKAINKMKEVSSENNRTVLFVSHNMNSIKKLCNRVIVLSNGKILKDSDPKSAIDYYLGFSAKNERIYKTINFPKDNQFNTNIIRLNSIKIESKKGDLKDKFEIDEDVFIKVFFTVLKSGYNACSSIGISYFNNKSLSLDGSFYILDDYKRKDWNIDNNFEKGDYCTTLKIEKNILNEGIFGISIDIFLPPANLDSSYQIRTKVPVIYFDVIDNFKLNSARGSYPYDWQLGSTGYMIRPDFDITTKKDI